MNFGIGILAVLAGYLLGSVSFSRLVARLLNSTVDPQKIVLKDDITGMEHLRPVRASTLSVVFGWKAGCLISLLDMLKVTLPTLLLRVIFPDQPYFLLAAAAGLVGNNWPVYYAFKGGTGISAIYGGLLVIDPLAIVVSAVSGLVIGLFLIRSFAVMFVLSLLAIIPWLWFRTLDPAYLAYGIAVNIVYLVMFSGEVKEYLRPGVRVMGQKEVMSAMPMGRGMLRMMERMGLSMDNTLIDRITEGRNRNEG